MWTCFFLSLIPQQLSINIHWKITIYRFLSALCIRKYCAFQRKTFLTWSLVFNLHFYSRAELSFSKELCTKNLKFNEMHKTGSVCVVCTAVKKVYTYWTPITAKWSCQRYLAYKLTKCNADELFFTPAHVIQVVHSIHRYGVLCWVL